MNIEKVSHPGIGIRVVTEGIQLALAEEALTARDRERHNDPVAFCKVFDFRTNLDNLAHEFVAENIARLHGWNVAIEEMQVGTADRRQAYFNYSVARID